MNNRIEIIIGSPIDYDELVAFILIDGKHIALLNQDEGRDKLKLEFFDDSQVNEVSLDLFLEAISEAKRALLK